MASNSADGALNVFGRSCAETYSGLAMDLLEPSIEMVKLDDIATQLGNVCRYGGAVRRFYSVAEHSVLVADLIDHLPKSILYSYEPGDPPMSPSISDLRMAALFHDAPEAYLQDIIAPLKWLLTRGQDSPVGEFDSVPYRELTRKMDIVVASKFDLDPLLLEHAAVKAADLWALRIEASYLTVSQGRGWRWSDETLSLGGLPIGVMWRGGLLPDGSSAKAFLDKFDEIAEG